IVKCRAKRCCGAQDSRNLWYAQMLAAPGAVLVGGQDAVVQRGIMQRQDRPLGTILDMPVKAQIIAFAGAMIRLESEGHGLVAKQGQREPPLLHERRFERPARGAARRRVIDMAIPAPCQLVEEVAALPFEQEALDHRITALEEP